MESGQIKRVGSTRTELVDGVLAQIEDSDIGKIFYRNGRDLVRELKPWIMDDLEHSGDMEQKAVGAPGDKPGKRLTVATGGLLMAAAVMEHAYPKIFPDSRGEDGNIREMNVYIPYYHDKDCTLKMGEVEISMTLRDGGESTETKNFPEDKVGETGLRLKRNFLRRLAVYEEGKTSNGWLETIEMPRTQDGIRFGYERAMEFAWEPLVKVLAEDNRDREDPFIIISFSYRRNDGKTWDGTIILKEDARTAINNTPREPEEDRKPFGDYQPLAPKEPKLKPRPVNPPSPLKPDDKSGFDPCYAKPKPKEEEIQIFVGDKNNDAYPRIQEMPKKKPEVTDPEPDRYPAPSL